MVRKVRSSAATTEGSDLSARGRMTRKRLQASHAQNSTAVTPSIMGPTPKSYWSQPPGSVIQGL
jgi:hypothetical protein